MIAAPDSIATLAPTRSSSVTGSVEFSAVWCSLVMAHVMIGDGSSA